MQRALRPSIEYLISLGPLPADDGATVSQIAEIEEALVAIEQPVTDQEAAAMVLLFGNDDCFGLAWTLLHLIETAPGWPIMGSLGNSENLWVRTLRERAGCE